MSIVLLRAWGNSPTGSNHISDIAFMFAGINFYMLFKKNTDIISETGGT